MAKRKKKPRSFITIITLVIIIISIFTITTTVDSFSLLSKSNKRINILIFGIDATQSSQSKGTRSDTIMLLNMGVSGKDPILISIPRDTRVEIPGRKYPEKINHAHAYGGIELLIDTVEGFLDIPIHYYARINYKAVEELVNALGGIEIDVPMDMKYTDAFDNPPLQIDIKKGLQTLNGRDSLHFLRFRSGYANQDLGRIDAQQQFANAIIKKVKSPTIIFKAPKLTTIFYSNIDTNIPKTRMLYLGIGSILGTQQELTKMTLPGSPAMIKGVSYYVADDKELQHMKENYLTPRKSVETSKIEVLNGCGINGVATKFAASLEASDLHVSSIGNYERKDVLQSFIEHSPQSKKAAKKIAKILNIKELIEAEGKYEDIDIKIVIGKDLGDQ
ncbi:LCP family protein [Natronincola ferrireducens]|uniref:Transcriptional attenuator, LytR family n=1 Tax=Natronincola ferrireducens TaxID=393762 RepID=A0A1G9D0Q0_9FIRM|nr:LCP family protein [Natronincola ferrireducens]SDK57429.1 transcriptional attenuator, LytR family [Natronincola ferrireducens]